MRNVISDETMEYVGILAKLELSPEEAGGCKKDMQICLIISTSSRSLILRELSL